MAGDRNYVVPLLRGFIHSLIISCPVRPAVFLTTVIYTTPLNNEPVNMAVFPYPSPCNSAAEAMMRYFCAPLYISSTLPSLLQWVSASSTDITRFT